MGRRETLKRVGAGDKTRFGKNPGFVLLPLGWSVNGADTGVLSIGRGAGEAQNGSPPGQHPSFAIAGTKLLRGRLAFFFFFFACWADFYRGLAHPSHQTKTALRSKLANGTVLGPGMKTLWSGSNSFARSCAKSCSEAKARRKDPRIRVDYRSSRAGTWAPAEKSFDVGRPRNYVKGAAI